MKTLIAAAFILGVLACAGAVLRVQPSCPRNFELKVVNGSSVCECVGPARPCPPRRVFDLDICRCRCDCPYGVEDQRRCTCRSVPEPTRPGSCVGSVTSTFKSRCSKFNTEYECTKNRCVWREGPRG